MEDDRTVIQLQTTHLNDLNPDRTVLLQPGLQVWLLASDGKPEKHFSFTHQFTVGRSSDNDIVIPSQLVSRHHFEVKREKGRWWIYDLSSANGVYINGKLVEQKSPLNLPALISLGVANSFLKIESAKQNAHLEKHLVQHGEMDFSTEKFVPTCQAHGIISREDLKVRLLTKTEAKDMGDYTRMIRGIIHEDRKAHSRGYEKVIWGLAFLFLFSAGWVTYQQIALSNVRDLAIDMFYDIKMMEVNLSQAEVRLEDSAEVLNMTMEAIVNEKLGLGQERIKVEQEKIAIERKRVAEERKKLMSMKAKYQQYVDEAKSLRVRFPSDIQYEEELIAKVARGFGESELELPKGFVAEVRRYIEYWQNSSRIEQAVKHLENEGYVSVMIDLLEQEGLPLYFMFLPLQESNYDTLAIGPETRFGIAKGAWQFLATTGQEYGLSPGPLAHTREYDEHDERFDFHRASRAGVKYLKHIYSTEAQASGLLVMASYNYGHTRVRSMISKMQDNPRDKNFWKFIQQYDIPKETYDYVFYIFSAAVIGEDPQHFGFSFKSPLTISHLR